MNLLIWSLVRLWALSFLGSRRLRRKSRNSTLPLYADFISQMKALAPSYLRNEILPRQSLLKAVNHPKGSARICEICGNPKKNVATSSLHLFCHRQGIWAKAPVLFVVIMMISGISFVQAQQTQFFRTYSLGLYDVGEAVLSVNDTN